MSLHLGARLLGFLLRTSQTSSRDDEVAFLGGTGAPSGSTYGGKVMPATQAAVLVRGDAATPEEMLYLTVDGGTTVEALADLFSTDKVRFFDDFVDWQAGGTELDHGWVLNSGTDDLAVDPLVTAARGGTIVATSGDSNTSMAADGSQFVGANPVYAEAGALLFKGRVKLDDITTTSVFIGLTDSKALEMAFTIDGADAITAIASDACGFVFDTTSLTTEWFGCAVDSTTVDTDSAALGSAPVNNTYQDFEIKVSTDGGTILFYLDGTLVLTADAAGVSPDVALYPTVAIRSLAAAARSATADYMLVEHTR